MSDTAAVVDRATGLALQGHAARAAVELAGLSVDGLDDETAEFRRAMIERFGAKVDPVHDTGLDDAWISGLVNAYVTYWHRALTGRQDKVTAEAELAAKVGEMVGKTAVGADIDEIEGDVQAEIKQRRYFALMGRTMPLLELMLWKSQRVSDEEVHLPEQDHRMRVTYLDDFVLRGWGHYATCGRRSTGGWATEDGLFAVVPAYKRIDDETFTVRFLAHEAQHSIDMRTFGKLEAWELEYRAKLTEVAMSQDLQADTFRRFCENASDADKDAPHAYANALILQRLGDRMGRIGETVDFCGGLFGDGDKLRESARELLREDTQNRGKA